MSFFKGHTRILYIKDGEDYKPVACLTSNPMSEGAEMLRTTTAESGGWRTSIPTNQYFSIDFEGMQIATGDDFDDTMLSYDTLREKKRSKELVEWQIRSSESSTVDEGSGYIVDINEENQVGDFLTFSGTIEGFGEPVFSRGAYAYWQNGDTMLFQNGAQIIFN